MDDDVFVDLARSMARVGNVAIALLICLVVAFLDRKSTRLNSSH